MNRNRLITRLLELMRRRAGFPRSCSMCRLTRAEAAEIYCSCAFGVQSRQEAALKRRS